MDNENGVLAVIPAPVPVNEKYNWAGSRNEHRQHGPIFRITPEEYERRLKAEFNPKRVDRKPQAELPRRKRKSYEKQSESFLLALANCDRALRQMRLGCLITGTDVPEKPVFDTAAPEFADEEVSV